MVSWTHDRTGRGAEGQAIGGLSAPGVLPAPHERYCPRVRY